MLVFIRSGTSRVGPLGTLPRYSWYYRRNFSVLYPHGRRSGARIKPELHSAIRVGGIPYRLILDAGIQLPAPRGGKGQGPRTASHGVTRVSADPYAGASAKRLFPGRPKTPARSSSNTKSACIAAAEAFSNDRVSTTAPAAAFPATV